MADSLQPIVQFKAGKCEVDDTTKPYKVKPLPTPGYIYLYKEEDIPRFAWRARNVAIEDANPTDDLLMFPGDGRFEPWNAGGENKGLTNGRIYRLSFDSSSAKHFFWLQAKNQHSDDKPDHWSERDLSLGRIVNEILSGEDVDANQLFASSRGPGGDDDDDDDDDDAEMHDADDSGPAAGGAGPGATGGNAMEEGEESRQGGEDGARAGNTRSAASGQTSQDAASAAVANLLQSLQGNSALAGQSQQHSGQGKLFTTLPDLLKGEIVLRWAERVDSTTMNSLVSNLPPELLVLEQEPDDISSVDPDPESTHAAIQALAFAQKRDLVCRVLRSPQFYQSLSSLTAALRDGGLPTISDALKIKVENGGFIRRGGVPLGGGEAVEAFLKGVKASAEEEVKQDKSASGNIMETD